VKWDKISIEFCGGTHVTKTGDIKELVILSEESIAKGIRRIFAITGWIAEDVCRKANDFDAKLRKVEAMPFSLEKLTFATTLKAENENNTGRIPTVRRSQFKERIKEIETEAAKIAKERAKADEKEIISVITRFFEGKEGEKKPGMVAALSVTPDPKLLGNSILTAMKKWKRKKGVYVLAVDRTKVVHVMFRLYSPPLALFCLLFV
jgi:alanyl-tRNA synthetase